MQKSTNRTRVLTGTAMLGAVAALLMYLEFPIPIMPAFIKLDVSAVAKRPVAGLRLTPLTAGGEFRPALKTKIQLFSSGDSIRQKKRKCNP